MQSVNDIKSLLMQALPPGSDGLYNFDNPTSKISRMFNSLANSYKQFAFDPTDSIYLEMNPVTMTQVIPNWENATGLASSKTTLRGSTDQRRAQVVGQLRGSGSLSLDDYRAIIEPSYKYQSVNRIAIAEPNRENLRALHSYSFLNSTPTTVTAAVVIQLPLDLSAVDDYLTTEMGAILSFEFKGTNIEDVDISISNQKANFFINTTSSNYFGVGSFSEFTTIYFYLQDPVTNYVCTTETSGYKKQRTIGKKFNGNWAANFGSNSHDYEIRNVKLFVEGMGRDHIVQDQGIGDYIGSDDRSVALSPLPLRDGEGLSHSMFHWAPIAETALLGSNPDIQSANSLIDHLKPAHTVARTAYKDPDEVLVSYPGNPDDLGDYRSIWGTDVGNLYIATSNGTILKFDGNTWNIDTTIALGVSLNAVKGADITNVWAVGDMGVVINNNGYGWANVSPGFSNGLKDVVAFEDGTALVVGTSGLIALIREDATFQVLTSGVTTTLNGIFSSSTSNKNDIWVVGDGGTLLRSINGATFINVGAPVGGNLQKISGYSSDDIYACGTSHELIHWNGIIWSPVILASIRDFYTVATTPLSPGDTWVGGTVGDIWHEGRFDFDFTQPNVIPTTKDLLGSWMGQSYELWMVGKDATIIRYAPYAVYPDSIAAIPDACLPS